MIKFYFSTFILGITINTFGQILNIPDANFKNRLVNTNCAQLGSPTWRTDVDVNNDGEIQVSEAANVLELDLSTSPYNTTNDIISLDGLANFTNLTELDCSGNSIASSEFSALVNLTNLDCSYNQLTALDVSGLPNLVDLRCSKNQLSELSISGLLNLKLVYCVYNNLTQLDLSGLTALEGLQCDSNQLSSLVLGNNPAVKLLSVTDNLLTSLNIQATPNLEYLWASFNTLSTLNFNGLDHLTEVNVISNALTSIDLSQAPLVNNLYCNNNPNLTSINVRNNYWSWGDPDLLFFPFRFEELPSLTTICMDDGEQNWLINTNYNASGNALVFGGPDCNIPLEISTSSTSDFDLGKLISVYPNPVEDYLKIEANAAISVQSISLYNLLGQKFKTFPGNESGAAATIDASNLKSGTYFIEIDTDKGKAIKKFIKQ